LNSEALQTPTSLQGVPIMLELLQQHPWLIIVIMALLIPICGIIFGTVTNHLTTVRKAELEAGLKQDMLERGMSAEEIRTVIEATALPKHKKWAADSTARRVM
jgi:hypothetical protein